MKNIDSSRNKNSNGPYLTDEKLIFLIKESISKAKKFENLRPGILEFLDAVEDLSINYSQFVMTEMVEYRYLSPGDDDKLRNILNGILVGAEEFELIPDKTSNKGHSLSNIIIIGELTSIWETWSGEAGKIKKTFSDIGNAHIPDNNFTTWLNTICQRINKLRTEKQKEIGPFNSKDKFQLSMLDQLVKIQRKKNPFYTFF